MLVIVNTAGPEVVPTMVPPKLMLVTAMRALACPLPEPVSVMVSVGFVGSFDTITSVAGFEPVAVGVKFTVTAHERLGGTVLQLLV